MVRRFLLLAVTAGAVLLVCSAVALAAVRTGTNGNEDLDGDGTAGSLVVFYGSGGSLVGQMLLANQFEEDEFSHVNGFPFAFDGRIEKIKFKNGTVTVTPEIVEPANARQGAPIAQRFTEDLRGEDLLP